MATGAGRGKEHRDDERVVVVITGASAGVGRATARKFAENGARIGLVARGLDGLTAAKIEVEALGGEALILPADVANPEEVEVAAQRMIETWGRIDVWINNAMSSVFSPVSAMKASEYARVTQVTYLGTVHGTLAALAHMRPRNKGVIVQVGSALGYRSIPLQSAYCAAKHAVVGFTDSLRTELLHERSGVRLTVVDLPALNTPQFDWVRSRLPGQPQPVPPIYQPEVAAKAIYYAAHHPRRRVEVGGPTVGAIFGQKLAPGLLDRWLARTGYASQQTGEPVDPDRPDNLWGPVRGDHGAHGRFDDRARPHSVQLWTSMHRRLLTLVGAALVGVSWLGWRAARRV